MLLTAFRMECTAAVPGQCSSNDKIQT